jgi:Four helix bundle sensory module for signal transduction
VKTAFSAAHQRINRAAALRCQIGPRTHLPKSTACFVLKRASSLVDTVVQRLFRTAAWRPYMVVTVMNVLRNLRLTQKLGLIVVVSVLATTATGLLGLDNAKRIAAMLDNTYNNNLACVALLGLAAKHQVLNSRAVVRMQSTHDAAELDKLHARAESFIVLIDKEIEQYRKLPWSDQERRLMSSYDQEMPRYIELHAQLEGMVRAGKYDEAAVFSERTVRPQSIKIEDLFESWCLTISGKPQSPSPSRGPRSSAHARL